MNVLLLIDWLIDWLISYKKLAPTNVDADKSQDLQDVLASWKPTRSDGIVLVQWLAGLNLRESCCVSLNLGKRPMSQFKDIQAGKSNSLVSLGESSLFYSGLLTD